MPPVETREKSGLLIITLVASLLLLADLVGFFQWYKNARSYIGFPIATLTHEIARNLGYTISSVVTNNSLKRQNIDLRQKVIELELLSQTYKTELEKHPDLNKLSESIKKSNYLKTEQAEILDIQAQNLPGQLLLNKGEKNGITKGMPVVFGNAYIGYISQVTTNDSLCTSYVVPGQEMVGYIAIKKITGIIKVSLSDMQLGDLLATEQVALHDVVSVKRENYPYFFALGLVSKVPLNNGSAERTATISSSIPISDLTYVTIVKE